MERLRPSLSALARLDGQIQERVKTGLQESSNPHVAAGRTAVAARIGPLRGARCAYVTTSPVKGLDPGARASSAARSAPWQWKTSRLACIGAGARACPIGLRGEHRHVRPPLATSIRCYHTGLRCHTPAPPGPSTPARRSAPSFGATNGHPAPFAFRTCIRHSATASVALPGHLRLMGRREDVKTPVTPGLH